MSTLLAGKLSVKIDGQVRQATGGFTYRGHVPERTTLMGPDGVHGYKEMPRPAFIEGALRDRGDFTTDEITNITNATITLHLANGKTFVLRNAVYVGSGEITSEEAELNIRFEGESGEELKA